MSDQDLRLFADVAWPALNHREARTRLESRGWLKCGEGDWAVTLRSPGAALAARISAFEPSYAWFLELCRQADGNPYVPRIDFASELEGGGHLTVLEYLAPVEAGEEVAFLKLIDLLGVAGGLIVDQIHADMDEFLRVIPRDRCGYILEIPHFTREYAAGQRAPLVADLVAYSLDT